MIAKEVGVRKINERNGELVCRIRLQRKKKGELEEDRVLWTDAEMNVIGHCGVGVRIRRRRQRLDKEERDRMKNSKGSAES